MTGGQAANTVALGAARHHVLAEAGWDVEQRGLLGGPGVRVVASGERHATIDRSLRPLGLGAGVIGPVAPMTRAPSTSATWRGCSPAAPPDPRPSACRPAT